MRIKAKPSRQRLVGRLLWIVLPAGLRFSQGERTHSKVLNSSVNVSFVSNAVSPLPQPDLTRQDVATVNTAHLELAQSGGSYNITQSVIAGGGGESAGGVATIEVPEDFRLVSDEKGLTVQVTPVGAPATIWCEKKSLDQIELKGSADVEFDYLVNGVRRLSKDHQPIVENSVFVPRSADDNLFRNLKPAALRRLKDTSILNEDGSVNMETVKKLDAYKRRFKQEQ